MFTFILLCIHFVIYSHNIISLLKGSLMLKKLVKYGNSNALVLDKAILELLDIAEGSLVKIKTDGKAIIITAHQASATQEKIIPVISHNEVLTEAATKEMLKQYKHLDKAQKELFEQEWSLSHQQLTDNFTHAEKQLQEITEEYPDTTSDEYQAKMNCLQKTVTSKSQNILEKMNDLPAKLGLPSPTEKQIADMQADFAEHFKKHAATQAKVAQVINDPEYMHELQLLSEKYANHDGDSTEYLKATREVLWKYVPEMCQADAEMTAIAKKYNPIE